MLARLFRKRSLWSRKDGWKKQINRPGWPFPIRKRAPLPVQCSAPSGFSRNDSQKVSDFFQKAIRLDPRLLGAHLSLADVYTIQGKPELALGLYRRILILIHRMLPPDSHWPVRKPKRETTSDHWNLRNPLFRL